MCVCVLFERLCKQWQKKRVGSGSSGRAVGEFFFLYIFATCIYFSSATAAVVCSLNCGFVDIANDRSHMLKLPMLWLLFSWQRYIVVCDFFVYTHLFANWCVSHLIGNRREFWRSIWMALQCDEIHAHMHGKQYTQSGRYRSRHTTQVKHDKPICSPNDGDDDYNDAIKTQLRFARAHTHTNEHMYGRTYFVMVPLAMAGSHLRDSDVIGTEPNVTWGGKSRGDKMAKTIRMPIKERLCNAIVIGRTAQTWTK